MKIVSITPVEVSALTSSVPLSETEWSAGTHNLGEQRRVGLDLYQVLVSSTTDEPTAGAVADPPTWGLLGKVNRWRMFDGSTLDQTTNADEITVAITPGSIVNAVVFNRLGGGGEIRVWMEDPTDGVVFDETVSLIDNSNVVDFYTYCFEPFQQRFDLAFLNLPPYGAATINAEITATNAACAEMSIGFVREIALTLNGTSVGTVRFGVRRTDAFGRTTFVRRQSVKRVNFEVIGPTASIDRFVRILDNERDQPAVFIGSELYDSLIVFGAYQDFEKTFSGPAYSDGTIRVEGL
ncbi:MAG: hypothetical protein CMK46_06900 [Porticoccus sp.]|jgi:hypothetical protein|uniref:hypothetical protein n=1 Tax=Pseudomonadota TaxID=1224 RepID=UPI000C6A4CBB|nr:hypothetical protein [Rhodospirillaceae bacterium]MAY26181.1 hypothetical protein [Polycyclovorans sp.]MBG58001.1 hypothetical protein [Porticoccus sp.]QDP49894.1 MAG: hypothetical protein GOVbin132_38 [Prokaryotic dsDNA virus sp.]MAX61608.1 hypothetical protein [Rhodospirillaceae bacterium]|tara:strand:+ start:38090 stop:38971 length:882 start_codon:yes stop_codon:yes gene_type:complete